MADDGEHKLVQSSVSGSKKKKSEDKQRRRDPKSWENVKKNMISMSEGEKLECVEQRYQELYNENRQLLATVQLREKQFAMLQKEKEKDQSDLAKAILTKGHLENLCRELQKQNKVIKEENIARIKEEEERRREVTNNFTEKLNTLTDLMTESKDKSNKVKEENQTMTDKLSELYVQFQHRERHLETLTRQMDLQKELSQATLKKLEIEHEAEKAAWLKEKEMLHSNLQKSENNVKVFQGNIKTLQAHLDVYKSQYSDFETTMAKSNRVFDTFKEEMAKMSKQISKIEKERNDWKGRWHSSACALIRLSEEHTKLQQDLKSNEKKVGLLSKLCRQLQTDRLQFIQQLKEKNIEPDIAAMEPFEELEPIGLVSREPHSETIVCDEVNSVPQEVNKLREKEELLSVLKKELAALQKDMGKEKIKIKDVPQITSNIVTDKTEGLTPTAVIENIQEQQIAGNCDEDRSIHSPHQEAIAFGENGNDVNVIKQNGEPESQI